MQTKHVFSMYLIFQIPDEHFEEFRLYRSSDDYDISIPAGAGIADADIIVYINVDSVEYCVSILI